MALEKQVLIDKIEVLEHNEIQVRQVTRVLEDGNELSANFHRWALVPGDDLTDQDPRVVAIANATWTPEAIASYEAYVQARRAAMP